MRQHTVEPTRPKALQKRSARVIMTLCCQKRKNKTTTWVTSGPHKLIRKCCLGLIVFKGKCLNLMRGLISANSAHSTGEDNSLCFRFKTIIQSLSLVFPSRLTALFDCMCSGVAEGAPFWKESVLSPCESWISNRLMHCVNTDISSSLF